VDSGAATGRTADERLTVVAALGDRLRRALYRFVAAQDRPVSRDEAAAAAGVSRSTAAFHLDRLVDEGLLDAEFRRLTGRRGPGAGRPTKLYRRSEEEVSVHLPPRQYDLAADLLAAAVTEATETSAPVATTLLRLARERGVTMAAAAAPDPRDHEAAAVAILTDHGYEPRSEDDDLVLANCPFHALVKDHRPLVCAMNLALLEGFTGGLPGLGRNARLQPEDRHCCVRLVPTAATTRRDT
jgi:predicted ArsR family transcriptional regulator